MEGGRRNQRLTPGLRFRRQAHSEYTGGRGSGAPGESAMRTGTILALLALAALAAPAGAAGPSFADATLARRAHAVLTSHCYRCHGKDGAIEGGLNYILDRDKLVARRKVVPGDPARSPLLVRVEKGKMPPPSEPHRPTPAEIATLREWISAGAPGLKAKAETVLVSEAQVQEWILSDLESLPRRDRKFTRYFSLVSLANAGAGPDELRTQAKAVAKLLN